MSLRFKLASIAAALIISSAAVAEEEISCPKLSAIKNLGIINAVDLRYHDYVGYTIDHFDTNDEWLFGIGWIEAESKQDAIEKANEILLKITASGVPDRRGEEVSCYYASDYPGIDAIAIKDFHFFQKLPKQFRHY